MIELSIKELTELCRRATGRLSRDFFNGLSHSRLNQRPVDRPVQPNNDFIGCTRLHKKA